METVSMEQIRETVARGIRSPAAARPSDSVAASPVVPKEPFRERLKRVPILSGLLVIVHRILMLPARVVYLVQRIDALQSKVDVLLNSVPPLQERTAMLMELVASLHPKHDAALRSIEVVASDLRHVGAELADDINAVGSRLAGCAENVVHLHEKTDLYAQMLRARIDAHPPVVHAGE